MNVIETKGLCFSYDGQPVLKDVSFTVPQGGITALVGVNGAGKTTLIKLLLGELPLAAGEIRLLGQDISKFKQWPRIGYVPQNGMAYHLDFPASVQEVVQANLYSKIGMFRFAKKEHKEMVEQTLFRVGMADYGRRLVGNLSGGQQQRVLLARALVNRPELMLLDEPTSGVDEESAEAFYQLLAKLNQELLLTILVVTHDIQKMEGIVTETLCLDHGHLVKPGSQGKKGGGQDGNI